ncbi:thiamine-phosphate synthase [Candidatus Methylomirabilis lanthanidiphila]|uniref:Thiamine-phosphate synthase n=1 Tax=Candidatus Methylomirabilis lanthanidiphila TaxID=2211376 RepID=A0A564ZM88_9BACT|nr:thiamine-phosphate synthase [Candidatus Methylomirabilis lanthanidiphila]
MKSGILLSTRNPKPETQNPFVWALYVVTDRSLTKGRPLEVVVEAALAGGAKAVQLREKDLSTRDLYELVERLLPIMRERGASLLINDRVDLALALPVDGVHLSRTSLPPAEARALLGPSRLIGVSCHSLEEAIEAEKDGADFIVFGPLFPTPSKAAYGAPVGLARLGEVRRQVRLLILGIGGITASNVASVIAAGADGAAAISAVMSADDPADAASALLRIIHSSPRGGAER